MKIQELLKTENLTNYVGEMYKVKGTQKKHFTTLEAASFLGCSYGQINGYLCRNKDLFGTHVTKDVKGVRLLDVVAIFYLALLLNNKSDICTQIYDRVVTAIEKDKESQEKVELTAEVEEEKENKCPIEMDFDDEADPTEEYSEEVTDEEDDEDVEFEPQGILGHILKGIASAAESINDDDSMDPASKKDDGISVKVRAINPETGEAKDSNLEEFFSALLGSQKDKKEEDKVSFETISGALKDNADSIISKELIERLNRVAFNILNTVERVADQAGQVTSLKLENDMIEEYIRRCLLFGLTREESIKLVRETALSDSDTTIEDGIEEYVGEKIRRENMDNGHRRNKPVFCGSLDLSDLPKELRGIIINELSRR